MISLTELIEAITSQFGALVTNITKLFSDNIVSIMTVVGLGIVLAVALGLIKKMKNR